MYTLEQRVFIVECFMKYSSMRECRYKFIRKFPGVRVPSRPTVYNLMKKFSTTGSVLNKKTEQERIANSEEPSDEEKNTKSQTRSSKRGKSIESCSIKVTERNEGLNLYEQKKRNTTVTETEDEYEYKVEKVINSKVHRGCRQFKIRWRGFGPDEDTWEPEEDLSCPELIQAYLDKHAEEDKAIRSKKHRRKASATVSDETKEYEAEEKDGEDEKFYEVEKIVDVQFKENGKRDFLIRWKGYSADVDTWEPEENLKCPEIIEEFMSVIKKWDLPQL